MISIHALLAESDDWFAARSTSLMVFQSTLSLRRATLVRKRIDAVCKISIHALLAESDPSFVALSDLVHIFQSTLSLRRATGSS